MFNLFKKQSPEQKLRKRYEKLMQEAFELSRTDRRASDQKTAKADAVLKEIEKLKATSNV